MAPDPFQRSRARMDDPQPDDAALVAAARRGDDGAFARLFRRHADAVRAHLTRLIGPVAEREDLLQAVFISFHRGLAGYRGEGSLTTFLHRVTVNAAYDHLRRRRGRRESSMAAPDDALDERPAPGTSHPEAHVEARADLMRLTRLLDRIAPKKRIAFVLVAVEGRSLAEAAALIGAREETVKQRALHARRELLQLMAEDDVTSAVDRKGPP
jgi:RNA polymerase sigma-70 factor (ECF subfamily)